jgi:hypothetical protein
MATTTNFGWETPDDTDLVKDGAAAIRTALGGVDTSFVDLKGGTTGQILSKASSTDLDFVWTADSGAPESLGFTAGKNKIINGDFSIWQRGTSFSNPTNGAFTSDRFDILYDGTGATRTISQQTFTPGAAPVAGYEGSTFFRFAVSAAGSGNTTNVIEHRIEDVRTFAGQTVTLSFWAKYGTTTNLGAYLLQNFGSGGSTQVNTTLSASTSIGTSWTRYTLTATLPSISGKTIGTNSYLDVYLALGGGSTFTFDIWGLQLESGSTATAFQTATGTIQGELAACQRYYFRQGGDSGYQYFGIGNAVSSTETRFAVQPPVQLRVAPNALEYSTIATYDTGAASIIAVTNLTVATTSKNLIAVTATVASGLTQYRPLYLVSNNSTNGYLAFSAEL